MTLSKMLNTGDLVFAKVRGWCPWPGKVMCQVSQSQYKIFFYGENTEGLVKIDNVCSARDNLEKFTKKYRKRKGYSRALEKMKNKPNNFAVSEFDLCPHKCITCDPIKMEASAKSNFQMEKNIVVNVDQCLTQIQSKKLQVFVKKIAAPLQGLDEDYSTDKIESENEEREDEDREKIPPPKCKSSNKKTEKELRVEAQEKSREEKEKKREEERKREEEEKKREEERKREEKGRKREEEERKREEEERQREEEEEERKRQEEERKRQEEERKRQEEERKHQEEERKRQKEERKRREKEKKRQEEERQREEEERQREEEERKCQEEERKRQEEERKCQEQERKRQEERKLQDEERQCEEEERKRQEKERKHQEERKREEEERQREEEERKRKEEIQREEEYCQVLFEMPNEKKRKRTSDQIVDYNMTDSDESFDDPVIISAPSAKAAKLIPLCAEGELLGQASQKQGEMETSSHWRNRLEQILKDAGDLDEGAYGWYRIDISNTERGNEHFFLELSSFTRRVVRVEDCHDRPVDVHVSLSSEDLAGVLDGSVSPVMAYLRGRITARGDFSKLLSFSQLSKKG